MRKAKIKKTQYNKHAQRYVLFYSCRMTEANKYLARDLFPDVLILGAPFLHFSCLSFEEHHSFTIFFLWDDQSVWFVCWVHSYLAISMDWPERKLTRICSGFLTGKQESTFPFKLSSATHHRSAHSRGLMPSSPQRLLPQLRRNVFLSDG